VVAFDQDDFKPALISQTLDKGAKGIQTNHPAELLGFLRARKLH
jgi:hypothetical protein